MSVFETATTRAVARANATVRLCAAREAMWRAERRATEAQGTPAEAAMQDRAGAATAEVATREQWLHWLRHGTTIRPAADGEWAPPARPPEATSRRRGLSNVGERAREHALARRRLARLDPHAR